MKNIYKIFVIIIFCMSALKSAALGIEREQLNDTQAGTSRQSVSIEDTLKFLKSANEYAFQNTTLEDIDGLERIIVVSKKMTDDDFNYLVPLCRSEKITFLNFVYGEVSGAGLKIIAEKCGTWESIQALDLGGNPLLEEHLTALSAFPNLKNLNIDFHGEGKSAVDGSFLKTVPLAKLEALWATGTSISNENALLLLRLPFFDKFNFRDVALSEQVLQKLSSEKINFHQPWDIRRIKYEAANAHICYHDFSAPKRTSNINFLLNQTLIAASAASFILGENLGLWVSRDWEDGSLFGFGICNGICKPKKAESPAESNTQS